MYVNMVIYLFVYFFLNISSIVSRMYVNLVNWLNTRPLSWSSLSVLFVRRLQDVRELGQFFEYLIWLSYPIFIWLLIESCTWTWSIVCTPLNWSFFIGLQKVREFSPSFEDLSASHRLCPSLASTYTTCHQNFSLVSDNILVLVGM